MRVRLVILSAVLLVVAAAGLWQWRHPLTDDLESNRPAAAARVPEPDRRLDLSGARDAAALESTLEDAYRIGPDRRMIAAVADLRALLATGDGVDLARAEWTTDHWTVRCGTDEAGTLPEYPLLADALRMLDGWARRELALHPLPAGSPDGIATAQLADFLPQEAFASLDAAARTGLTRALVGQALTASCQLALLLREDRSGSADSVCARALALLALARAADGGSHVQETCMLAWAMGYGEEARSAARALGESDPIALLVCGRMQAVERLASAPGAPRAARLAHLMLLARQGNVEGWFAAAERAAGPSGSATVYSTALAFRRFDIARGVGGALAWAAFENAASAPDDPGPDAATLQAFERRLQRAGAQARGRLSGGVLVAAARARFYSGLTAEHEFYTGNLASTQAVLELRDALAPALRGPGGWFVRWQAAVASAYAGHADTDSLWAALADPEIPEPLLRASYAQLVARMPYGCASARAAVRSLAARADSRPASAFAYALTVQEQIHWPSLTERLLAHASRAAGLDDANAVLLLALMRSDYTRIAAVVDDPDVDVDAALRALRMWTASDSSSADLLLPRFARLCQRAPTRWAPAEGYTALLEARGRLREAEDATRRWQRAADSTCDALDPVLAATRLARLQRKQGRLTEALVSLGDADESWQHGAMREKATLLFLTGKHREAFALARRIEERYGQLPSARTFALQLMWRAGRYDDVARKLTAPDATERYPDSQLAEDFVEVFAGRYADARTALASMRENVKRVAALRWYLAQAFARAGDLTFASELAHGATIRGGAERAFALANAFDIMARAANVDSARTWLQAQHMGADTRVLLDGLLLMHGHAPAAYALTASGAGAEPDEYAWLLRAAAWRLEGGRRDDWRAEIRAHCAKATPGDYDKLTRFVLGEIPEADVLALAVNRKRQNEVWLFCAVRAWGEGRSEDALRWLLLCQEAESTTDAEYFWATRRLRDWAGSWRSVRLLQMNAPRAV